MKRSIGRIRLVVLIGMLPALLAAANGCRRSDGVERVPLSGSVSFDGQPVVDGQIRFVPQSGVSVPLAVAKITEGRYELTYIGGIPVGRFRVEIRAFDPKTSAPRFPGDPQRTQLLPDKFNTQSDLELTVQSGQGDLNEDYHLSR